MIDKKTFTETLETVKAFHLETVAELQELRQICKPLDGKMFNRRIPAYIVDKGGDKYRAHIRGDKPDWRTLEISTRRPIPYNQCYKYELSQTLFASWVNRPEGDGTQLVRDKRFSYSDFNKQVAAYVQSTREKIAAIDKDLLDGLERLEEFERAAAYARQMYHSFSSIAKQAFLPSQSYFR